MLVRILASVLKETYLSERAVSFQLQTHCGCAEAGTALVVRKSVPLLAETSFAR
jgi:hypothetical protein